MWLYLTQGVTLSPNWAVLYCSIFQRFGIKPFVFEYHYYILGILVSNFWGNLAFVHVNSTNKVWQWTQNYSRFAEKLPFGNACPNKLNEPISMTVVINLCYMLLPILFFFTWSWWRYAKNFEVYKNMSILFISGTFF